MELQIVEDKNTYNHLGIARKTQVFQHGLQFFFFSERRDETPRRK